MGGAAEPARIYGPDVEEVFSTLSELRSHDCAGASPRKYS
jgi:hypothetical protein